VPHPDRSKEPGHRFVVFWLRVNLVCASARAAWAIINGRLVGTGLQVTIENSLGIDQVLLAVTTACWAVAMAEAEVQLVEGLLRLR